MSIKIKVLNSMLPFKATEHAAGYDIITNSEPKIVGEIYSNASAFKHTRYSRIDYIEYKTGLFLDTQEDGLHTLIHPRSSISKYNLVLANSIGLCDADYRGEILIRFKYVWQPEDIVFLDPEKHPSLVIVINKDKIYKQNDKIAQLVFAKTFFPEFVLADELTETARGNGGFGHTDKKNLDSPVEKRETSHDYSSMTSEQRRTQRKLP